MPRRARPPEPPRLSPYLNRVIDSALHPLAERDRRLYAVDTALHVAVELADQLVLSLYKAAVYNLPRALGGEGK